MWILQNMGPLAVFRNWAPTSCGIYLYSQLCNSSSPFLMWFLCFTSSQYNTDTFLFAAQQALPRRHRKQTIDFAEDSLNWSALPCEKQHSHHEYESSTESQSVSNLLTAPRLVRPRQLTLELRCCCCCCDRKCLLVLEAVYRSRVSPKYPGQQNRQTPQHHRCDAGLFQANLGQSKTRLSRRQHRWREAEQTPSSPFLPEPW